MASRAFHRNASAYLHASLAQYEDFRSCALKRLEWMSAGDLSDLLLKDEELWQAMGMHFVNAAQLAHFDVRTSASLGLQELTACEFVHALLRLQEQDGVDERGKVLLARGGAFFDGLFAYLWRHRALLSKGTQSAQGVPSNVGSMPPPGAVQDLLKALHIIPFREIRTRSKDGHRNSSNAADMVNVLGALCGPNSTHHAQGANRDSSVDAPIYLAASTAWLLRAAQSCGMMRILSSLHVEREVSKREDDSVQGWCGCFSPFCSSCLQGFAQSLDHEKRELEQGQWCEESMSFLKSVGVMGTATSQHLECIVQASLEAIRLPTRSTCICHEWKYSSYTLITL